MDTTITTQRITVPAWAWALTLLMLGGAYLVTMENGLALSAGAADRLHELFHDARHLIGVPCH